LEGENGVEGIGQGLILLGVRGCCRRNKAVVVEGYLEYLSRKLGI
jgi:hypothetical protein